jgi:hypothetical protein
LFFDRRWIEGDEVFFGGIVGAFHHVIEDHLGRYINEFAFRWNNRKIPDSERMVMAVKGIEGKK